MAAVTLDAVAKRFGDTAAIDGISLAVDDGEFVAVFLDDVAGQRIAVFQAHLIGKRGQTASEQRRRESDEPRYLIQIVLMLTNSRMPTWASSRP